MNALAIVFHKELSDYARVVSHDLKAPLINIHTLITWFIQDNKDTLNESVLSPLQQVLFNVEKMDYLIKAILDYSTVYRLDTEDRIIDLKGIINDVLNSISVPKHITIDLQEKWPNIYGSEWRFRQVFKNLLQNAILNNDKERGTIILGSTEKKDTMNSL